MRNILTGGSRGSRYTRSGKGKLNLLSKQTLEVLKELETELNPHDPIAQNFKYKAFVSKSKGIRYRNGVPYRRIRKQWKDIELVSYRNTGFHLWHNFPFDEVATESLPGWEEWKAIDYIQEKLRENVLYQSYV